MTSSSVFFIFLLLTLLLTASSDLTALEKFITSCAGPGVSSKELIQMVNDTIALTSFKAKDESEDQFKNELLDFKEKLGNPDHKIDWDKSKPTCEWQGVHCVEGQVIHLCLPAKSLLGQIPPHTLGKITSLRILSLHSNKLSGGFPEDFADLTELRNVYLHNNNFSGEFPTSVTKWTKLRALDISYNNFTGTIPSISDLKGIMHFKLQNNRFTGSLPVDFPSRIDSTEFSVSNNSLSGPIPKNLAEFPPTVFSGGNFDLCGKPLSKTCKYNESGYSDSLSSGDKKKKKLSTGNIAAIAVGSALILPILLCLGNKWSQAVKEENEPGVATMAAAAKAERGFGGGGEAEKSSSKDGVTGMLHPKTK